MKTAPFLLLLAAGCSTHDMRVVPPHEIQERWLGFLKVGETTREDVLLKLGHPSGQFEGGRILTFRMGIVTTRTPRGDGEAPIETQELVLVGPEPGTWNPYMSGWRTSRFSLVLVFDERHKLAKHSVVQVK